MRDRYVYEIQRRGEDGRWGAGIRREDAFVRDPKSIARSLLERWVIDHPGQVNGGVRVIVTDRAREPENARAVLRVRLYRGMADVGSRPVATAYLAYDLDEVVRPRRRDWSAFGLGRGGEARTGWGDAA